MSEREASDDALPSGILGVDSYKLSKDNYVTDVKIIERSGDEYAYRWLGEDNHTVCIGTPEGWQCIGACTNDWDDSEDHMNVSTGAVAVYVAPDGTEWTTTDLPMIEDNE